MAQTPCLRVDEGYRMDRIFAADAKAGEIVLVGTKPVIVTSAVTYSAAQPNGTVDVRGMWDIPQKAEAITGGDAVYWDPTGNPYGGTVGSGAATATATAYPLGRAAAVQINGTAATTNTDTYVRVLVENFTVAATVAGAVTADSIAASDASLGVTGLSAAQGGAIVVTGGTSSTAANAGGAITITGGTPGAEGVGGALTLTGGAGGSTSGTGGAVSIAAGAGTAGNANGGAMTILAGNAHGSGTDGVLALGTSNTSAINVGAAGIVTYIAGSLRVSHTVTPVAAAGSAVADAGALADVMITHITSDGATKGVKLPAVLTAGVVRIVVNNSSTAAEIYAESTGTINGAAADASMVIPASKGVLCISTAAKTWIAFDLPALASAS